MNQLQWEFTQADFVFSVQVPVPVILSVPHDGVMSTPYLDGLFRRRQPDRRRSVVVGRDLRVFPIVKDIFRHAPTNIVYGMLARSCVDYNRPPDIAFEDESLRRYYDAYHRKIVQMIAASRSRHGRTLLLDMHGFGRKRLGIDHDVLLGTSDRRTVRSGIDLDFGRFLEERGYSVLHVNRSTFGGSFNGRFNVRYYAERYGCDAILVEVSPKYRREAESKKHGCTLSRHIGDFLNSRFPTARPA